MRGRSDSNMLMLRRKTSTIPSAAISSFELLLPRRVSFLFAFPSEFMLFRYANKK
jgi:hypothetical protein